MNTSTNELARLCATRVDVTEDTLFVELKDGRSFSVPVSWYPRLAHASPEERNDWEFIGAGFGIHWPQIDEDISVEGLVAGEASNESQESLNKWLEKRRV